MVVQMLFPLMDEENESLPQEAAPSRGLTSLWTLAAFQSGIRSG